MGDTERSDKGLLLLFTGEGKGKTTAALGMAFRALGHGQRVSMIQFIKGSWHCGELEAAKRFEDLLEVHVTGRGFTWKSDDLDKDIALARQGWELARSIIQAGASRLVILDELTYLFTYGMLDETEVLTVLVSRPQPMNIVITGRGASAALREACDLVTEMRELKHPYRLGVKARAGVEY